MSKPILLVEDEDSDVTFMQIAMEGAGVKNPLNVVRDGRQAIAYLNGDGEYADRQQYPLPGLVLLDLRLPYIPGLAILKWLRQQPAFARTTVLVLSSSDQDSDVEAAYRLGANAYIVKPPLVSELERIVRLIKQYWLDSESPPANCPEWEAVVVAPPKAKAEG
jgi:two-component system response regulator